MVKINNLFLKFFAEIGESKQIPVSTIDAMRDFGDVKDLDLNNNASKGIIEVVNCINNPFYFLNKLKTEDNKYLDINIASFAGIATLEKAKGPRAEKIVISIPKGVECKNLVYGYGLWKILFSNDIIYIRGKDQDGPKELISLYNKMPNYLKIKSEDEITNQISKNPKLLTKTASLIIYNDIQGVKIDSNIELSANVPIIIIAEGGDIRNLEYSAKHEGNKGIKLCRYTVEDLRLSKEFLADKLKELGVDDFLEKIMTLYTPYTDEEYNSLPSLYQE